MRPYAIPLLLLPLLWLPAPAPAQTIDSKMEYRTCLNLARAKPDEGWEEALAWASLGGGEPARHCAAVALIGLGKYEEAAKRLEALASSSRREEAMRAEMLAQAGQAWLLAGKPQLALAAQDTALKLVPGHPELMLDKAVTLASANHYAEVAELLSALLKTQPNRIEAMVLRAVAYRYLDKLELAKDDLARALVLDPTFPDALLERGIIRRLEDDQAGAREDWMKAINAAPESSAADTARRNLEMMDVKVK
ncbi:Putative FOG: TPR repeat(Tetratricopeptide-like helica,65-237) [Magnetospirillum sp. XM-1]|uniref:tetratricopeptide repeat protein n=1 Tax=Magnetospirillum sp. XM-1 TaxID=1663591 RepID=UPI00073E005D|nr:tetratricopeptide repeat protein [Magnetospirillum sp. XM-1]CUW38511.1 Putative FOG: TPR repeat(Tetratricopeptide-like helica,65-237) [Magnetospirillum sp. XM-1]